MQLAAGTMAEIAADSHGSSSDCRGRGQLAIGSPKTFHTNTMRCSGVRVAIGWRVMHQRSISAPGLDARPVQERRRDDWAGIGGYFISTD
jgi:hypothetical protein